MQKNAEEALVCLTSIPRKTIFLGIAFVASSLISTTAIESWRHVAGQEGKAEIEAKAVAINTRMISILRLFGKTVAFSSPRALICEAVSECLKGQEQKGLKMLSKAEILAVKLNLPMDRALALYYKCTFSKDTSLQDTLLSESIFTSIGAEFEAERAKVVTSSC